MVCVKDCKALRPFRVTDVAEDGDTLRLISPVSGPRFPVFVDPEVSGYVQEHFCHSTEQFGIADDGRLLLTMRVAINPELEGKIRKWTPNVEGDRATRISRAFKKYAAKE